MLRNNYFKLKCICIKNITEKQTIYFNYCEYIQYIKLIIFSLE